MPDTGRVATALRFLDRYPDEGSVEFRAALRAILTTDLPATRDVRGSGDGALRQSVLPGGASESGSGSTTSGREASRSTGGDMTGSRHLNDVLVERERERLRLLAEKGESCACGICTEDPTTDAHYAKYGWQENAQSGREATHELPDFHPETGHLHTCNGVGPCACAARLYEVADDLAGCVNWEVQP